MAKKSKSGIHINPKKKGAFTKKAKAAGKGVQEYAREVMKEGSHASAATKKQANFAKNAAKFHHGKKKAHGRYS
ncbi:MAG: hypothetical protein KGI03_00895 [Patescibacteria group bacterium]|nr:hypothetical protein [Patescibacteria group bacterium]